MKKTLILFLMLVASVLVGVKPMHAAATPPCVEVSSPDETLDHQISVFACFE